MNKRGVEAGTEGFEAIIKIILITVSIILLSMITFSIIKGITR